MDQFGWAVINPATGQPVLPYQFLLPMEYTFHYPLPATSTDPDIILDMAGLRYAQSEVIAFHVLSMNVRLFCLPAKTTAESLRTGPPAIGGDEAFVEAGFATGIPPAGNPAYLSDTTKNWNGNAFTNDNLRISAGTAAGQSGTISGNTATTISLIANTGTIPATGIWPALPGHDLAIPH